MVQARIIQAERFREFDSIYCNAMMPSNMVKQICAVNDAGRAILKTAMERLGLTARAYDWILKVSRTVADLANSPEIKKLNTLAKRFNTESR